jgi:hypothetical protein
VAAESIFRQIRGLLLAVAVAAGLIYLLIALGSVPAPEHAVQDQTVSSLPPGNEGQLRNGNSAIPLAIDEDLLPDLIRAATASDYANAISNLTGRLFFVTPGTSVRVSETGRKGVRVRILTGPERGRLGWVPPDWVKPV